MIGVDRIDVLILKEIIDNGELSSYAITKRIFKLPNTRKVRDKSKSIDYKLERLVNLGVVKKKKGKSSLYFIDKKRCFLFKGPVIHGKVTTQIEEGIAIISKNGEMTTIPIKLV